MSAAAPVDYEAIAAQNGAVGSSPIATPAPAVQSQGTDYDSLAAQHGAVGTQTNIDGTPIAETGDAFVSDAAGNWYLRDRRFAAQQALARNNKESVREASQNPAITGIAETGSDIVNSISTAAHNPGHTILNLLNSASPGTQAFDHIKNGVPVLKGALNAYENMRSKGESVYNSLAAANEFVKTHDQAQIALQQAIDGYKKKPDVESAHLLSKASAALAAIALGGEGGAGEVGAGEGAAGEGAVKPDITYETKNTTQDFGEVKFENGVMKQGAPDIQPTKTVNIMKDGEHIGQVIAKPQGNTWKVLDANIPKDINRGQGFGTGAYEELAKQARQEGISSIQSMTKGGGESLSSSAAGAWEKLRAAHPGEIKLVGSGDNAHYEWNLNAAVEKPGLVNAAVEKPGLVKQIIQGKDVAQQPAGAAIRSAAQSGAEDAGVSAGRSDSFKTVLKPQVDAIRSQAKSLYAKIDQQAGFDVKQLQDSIEDTKYKIRQATDPDLEERLQVRLEQQQTKLATVKNPELLDQAKAKWGMAAARDEVQAKVFNNPSIVSGNASIGVPEKINVNSAIKALEKLRSPDEYGNSRLVQAFGEKGADGLLKDLYAAQKIGAKALSTQQTAKLIAKWTAGGIVGGELIKHVLP